MAKYLVTGAAGFIGRSIAAELLKRGEAVRGIDNLITGKRENLAGIGAMEFIEGDLADAAACAEACKGVEVVFHEAALASVPRSVADPVSTNVNCVNATLNVLVAARDGGEVAGEALLPGAAARISPTTFDDWLELQVLAS